MKQMFFSIAALCIFCNSAYSADMGTKFGGGIGIKYSDQRSNGVENETFNVYGARIDITQPINKDFFILFRADASDSNLVLDRLEMNYKVNSDITVKAGKGFYGYTSLRGIMNAYRGAFTTIAGSSGLYNTGNYIWGGEIDYKYKMIEFITSGGVNTKSDLLDSEQFSDNNSELRFMGDSKYRETMFAELVRYNRNNVMFGVGYMYDNKHDNGASLESINKYIATGSYLNDNFLLLFNNIYEDSSLDYRRNNIVLAFMVNTSRGKFDNFANIAKADNMLYAGMKYENSKKTYNGSLSGNRDDTSDNYQIYLGFSMDGKTRITAEYGYKIENTIPEKKSHSFEIVSRTAF